MPVPGQIDTNNNRNNKMTTNLDLDAKEEALEIVFSTTPDDSILSDIDKARNNSSQTLINHLEKKSLTSISPAKHNEQQIDKLLSQNNLNNDNVSLQHSPQKPLRSLEELTHLLKDIYYDRTSFSNEELIRLIKNQQLSVRKLESFLGKGSAERCVEIRRNYYRLEHAELDKFDQLGIKDRAAAFDKPINTDLEYEKVNGACCENVIGHVKVPVGIAGPLALDGKEVYVPLATTEGCLVASTNRGFLALRQSGGVSSRVRRDFMTRAPIIRFTDPKLTDALHSVERAIAWLNDKNNKERMKTAFDLTSSHGKLIEYSLQPHGREIHIRFIAHTGDAMGMNMCSKGAENALREMQRFFPTLEIVTLSGNMCTDKKAAAINWIDGRGKSVECNAELPANVVQQVFKVSVDSMIDRWKSKVMFGSAFAASIGGFNCQAANIVTAIFIATGQDPAQTVTSSNCILTLEKDSKGSLVACCSMPSIECGTVGGGTILGDQSRYLQMMGIRGSTPQHLLGVQHKPPRNRQSIIADGYKQLLTTHDVADGNLDASFISDSANHSFSSSDTSSHNSVQSSSSSSSSFQEDSPHKVVLNEEDSYTNARQLARIVCATVMAAELSLLASLTEGTLVKSHMRHNRSGIHLQCKLL